MVFSSPVFLFIFLPAVLLAYFLFPKRARIYVLLIFSLAFYGYGEPLYLGIMLVSIAANFGFGAWCGRLRERDLKAAKRVVVLSVVFNLALLGFFKYADFFLGNIALIPGLSGVHTLGIALPIGISFYTFQSMSYTVDVYRGDAPVQRSIAKFGTYVSFFPQLIAGPIVRYKTIAEQLDSRSESPDKFKSGVVMFMIGLAKKVLLANSFGQLWDTVSAMQDRSALSAWLGIIAFSMQIYFDFGGYSDMAIGLGRMFGFEFLPNFKYPYMSRSVSEFWASRWHISLGTWFREYLYIPLGGNRHGIPRQVLNLAIVWLLTGLWHGASWNFVLWGAYYAVLLIVEKLFLGKLLLKLPTALRIAYAVFAAVIGWVIFALTDVSQIGSYITSMFAAPSLWDDAALYAVSGWMPLIGIGVIGCTPLPARLYNVFAEKHPRTMTWVQAALILIALVLCTAYIVDASYNPFLYFRF